MSIENIIKAYQMILERVVKNHKFDTEIFKNTMEPIFNAEGYRRNMFDSKNSPTNQLRIMILQDASIGDFILLSPAIREIRRIYPTARISLVINVRVYEIAVACPYVDEVIQFNFFEDMRDFPKTFEHYIQYSQILLERHFDVAFLFNHFVTTSLLAYMSGARDRIITKDQGNPLDFGIDPARFTTPLVTTILPKMSKTNHYVDKNLKMLDYLIHSQVVNRELEIWYTPEDMNFSRNTLLRKKWNGKKVCTLTLGGTRPTNWCSPEQYAAFMEMVFEKDPDIRLVLLGWGREMFFAQVFLKHLNKEYHNRVWNLVGKLSLRQTSALISLCYMHMGNDTGTIHVASADKIPVLLVSPYPADQDLRANTIFLQFAPYHVPAVVVQPEKSLPECVNSEGSHGCISIHKPHCIKTIKPEKIFEGFNLLTEKIFKRDRTLSLVH